MYRSRLLYKLCTCVATNPQLFNYCAHPIIKVIVILEPIQLASCSQSLPMALLSRLFTIISLLILSAKFCTGQAEEDYGECSTKKLVLLQALYNTSDNLYELERAFTSPQPGEISSRFIKITYSFANLDGKYDDCNVTYIWAIGGFYLIQPPQIFMFTSLLFSTPANSRENIALKLPYHCRKLINSINDECTCYSAEDRRSEPMIVLTNQVSNNIM